MNKVIFTLFFVALIVHSECSIAQQNPLITTKRDLPIGVVSFGSSVISGVLGADNFVDGYVKKSGEGKFIFPVGDNGAFRPFAASNESTGAYFGVDPGIAITSNPTGGDYGVLPAEGPFNTNTVDAGIHQVTKKEYWDINGSLPTKITLSWNADSEINSLLETKDLSKLTITGWNGTKWVKIPSLADAVSVFGGNSSKTSGSITTDAAVVPDNYNVFSLGVLKDGTLPVTLVSFQVKASEGRAELTWNTSSEVNSSHFDVERSPNGKSWLSLGQLAAQGDSSATFDNPFKYNFMDEKPLTGINFYRLKMVDRDETFAYSTIRTLEFHMDATITIYPNPVAERLFLAQNGSERIRQFNLTDLKGNTVFRGITFPQQGLDVSHLPQNTYLVNMTLTDGTVKSLKILTRK